MKVTSTYYSDDNVYEYEEETDTLFIWGEDRMILGSLQLDKEQISALIDFLTSVQMELL